MSQNLDHAQDITISGISVDDRGIGEIEFDVYLKNPLGDSPNDIKGFDYMLLLQMTSIDYSIPIAQQAYRFDSIVSDRKKFNFNSVRPVNGESSVRGGTLYGVQVILYDMDSGNIIDQKRDKAVTRGHDILSYGENMERYHGSIVVYEYAPQVVSRNRRVEAVGFDGQLQEGYEITNPAFLEASKIAVEEPMPEPEPEPPVFEQPPIGQPEEPPTTTPPSSALPAIGTGTVIGGGLLIAVLHKPTRKKIEKALRRLRI